jgi:uncharacterized membrane protein
MSHIYASFSDYKMAERAVGALLDHGLEKEHVSLVARNHDGKDHEQHAESGITTTTAKDAAAGAAKGAGVGLVAGALGALASLLIPGFGLVTGGGALATALGAAAGTTAAGAAAGGVVGALQDQGVDAEVARNYDKELENGGALVQLVVPSGKLTEAQARETLAKYNANNVHAVNR